MCIRDRGTAVFDDDPAAVKKAFETLPLLANMYNEKTGQVLGLLYITNGEAEIADMKGYFETFNF